MSAHHGNTPAAWTAVTVVLVGFVLGGLALVIGPNWPLFWIGVACAPIGGIAGVVMAKLGMGAEPVSR
jgi:peptidoglycan/LPS O-acetylase OafA/YrhL